MSLALKQHLAFPKSVWHSRVVKGLTHWQVQLHVWLYMYMYALQVLSLWLYSMPYKSYDIMYGGIHVCYHCHVNRELFICIPNSSTDLCRTCADVCPTIGSPIPSLGIELLHGWYVALNQWARSAHTYCVKATSLIRWTYIYLQCPTRAVIEFPSWNLYGVCSSSWYQIQTVYKFTYYLPTVTMLTENVQLTVLQYNWRFSCLQV